jgi:ubiquinone/menaquinone biosynthesis C-methylase UbiE
MKTIKAFLGFAFLLVLIAALWWRKNPSACPYGQRFWVEAPHPLITRARLKEALDPKSGDRILEVGPGTGYYSLDAAGWVGPDGSLEIFDIQQEMLDHTIARAEESGVGNIRPTQGDAQVLPYEDSSFDAAFLVTTLGEIPDQQAAVSEFSRVLKPGGRLVVGELMGDPHWVSPKAIEKLANNNGLHYERRIGSLVGSFSVLSKR